MSINALLKRNVLDVRFHDLTVNGNLTTEPGDVLSLGDALENITGHSVTQTGSLTSAVTMNGGYAYITTVTATIAPGSATQFTLNNNLCSANDIMLVQIVNYTGSTPSSGAITTGIPFAASGACGSGSCAIKLANISPSTALNGTITIRAQLIKNY